MSFLKLCLSINQFKFRRKHYELVDGLTMGSPVLPPVARLLMADFEVEALGSFKGVKPTKWRRYVDDVISVVKRNMVDDLLAHLNSRHKNIQFTVEMEEDGRLPVLDIVIHRLPDGRLNTTVFRKPTHTERYLPFSSHHPSSMKVAVVKSLTQRLEYITEGDSLEKKKELAHIMDVLSENGYPRAFLEKCMKRRILDAGAKEKEKLKVSVCLPYVRGLSEQIRRILDRLEIGVVFKPDSWKASMMVGVKDAVEAGKRSGVVYEIECETCDKMYIGETGRSIEKRVKEHRSQAKNGHAELSAVAEHVLEGHCVKWDPKILASATRTRERRIKEALLIHGKDKLGKITLNRDKGLEVSDIWLDLF